MPAVRSWKFLGLTTPHAFGGCRWAGTVCNEDPGRGGRELGNGRCKGGTGRRQRARSREPADRHRPPCPSPRVPRSHQVTGARVAGPAGGWSARPGAPHPGSASPAPLALAGADPAGGLSPKKWGFPVARKGVPSRGESGGVRRGAGPRREVTGRQRRFLVPAVRLLPRLPLPPLRGPPRSPSPSGGRYGRSLGAHEALGESG